MNKLKEFLKTYEDYKKQILKPALEEIDYLFKQWESPEYWFKVHVKQDIATPPPVRTIMTRIKKADKVVEKIYRKPNLFPDGLTFESIQQMHDVIGVRIIVYFSSQLSMIDRELRNSNKFIISSEAPPEAYFEKEQLGTLGLSHIEDKQKESGYSSIHYTVQLANGKLPQEKRPTFEIQVRTMAQELWSELEHILCYKPETRPDFSAKRRLQILSKEIGVIDEQFNLLYEELVHSQEKITYKDADILTFENIPKVLNEVGVSCAITELNSIIKILFGREIFTVKNFLDLATPMRLSKIRNNYQSITGKLPNTIELVSVLAFLKDNSNDEIESIQTQIQLQQTLNL